MTIVKNHSRAKKSLNSHKKTFLRKRKEKYKLSKSDKNKKESFLNYYLSERRKNSTTSLKFKIDILNKKCYHITFEHIQDFSDEFIKNRKISLKNFYSFLSKQQNFYKSEPNSFGDIYLLHDKIYFKIVSLYDYYIAKLANTRQSRDNIALDLLTCFFIILKYENSHIINLTRTIIELINLYFYQYYLCKPKISEEDLYKNMITILKTVQFNFIPSSVMDFFRIAFDEIEENCPLVKQNLNNFFISFKKILFFLLWNHCTFSYSPIMVCCKLIKKISSKIIKDKKTLKYVDELTETLFGPFIIKDVKIENFINNNINLVVQETN